MTPNDPFNAIYDLDLDPIKVKLMHEASGEGWSLEKASAVEFEYRRFLILMKMFPNEHASPLFDVDIFWHYHILDTQKYAADCAAIFGYFLHHFPYVGLRGEADETAHRQVGMRMKELYEHTFGGVYGRVGGAPEPALAADKSAWSVSLPNAAWSVSLPNAPATASAPDSAWSVSLPNAPAGAIARPAVPAGAVQQAGFFSTRPTLNAAH